MPYTNQECKHVLLVGNGTFCNQPVWILPNGLRVNTPYCEEHARAFSDARMTDWESIAGS